VPREHTRRRGSLRPRATPAQAQDGQLSIIGRPDSITG